MDIFYLTITSVCLYFIKTYLKTGQGHLKDKVKVIQDQGQVNENQFSIYL